MITENQYLLNYRKNIASQFGEDGIIEEILKKIPDQNNWSVEFGAWDGKFCSNTYNLIHNKKWNGILIEGDKSRINDIYNNYEDTSKLIIINKFVNFEGNDILDSILTAYPIPIDFDLLSIDIDGNDYHIWETLKIFKPKIVLIEFNPFIPSNIEFIQPKDLKVMQGNSILSMVKLGKKKGYELICINQENAFFVDNKYYDLFKISDNSIEALKHFKEPLQVFQLYDGTMVFHGSQCLFYHNIPVNFNKKFQIIPKIFRDAHLPWNKNNKIIHLLFKIYERLILKHNIPNDKFHEYCWGWKEKY